MNNEKPVVLLSKMDRVGKNGKRFLILKIDSKKIFVFNDYVPERYWDKLQAGERYLFDFKSSKVRDYVLHGFKVVKGNFKDIQGNTITVTEE
jgi:hypothetical protein